MNVILHIGQAKTGTSSIQRFLYHNRELLESCGYYYHTYDDSSVENIQKSLLSDGGFEFYNHSDILLQLFSKPYEVKKYIENLIQVALEKKLHTVIISSELLFDGVFQKHHITVLVQMINYPIKAVLFLKRPDLYIESLWQQWYFKDFPDFQTYLKNKKFPVYYPQISFWKKSVNMLKVIPFEKRYFSQGLERCFLETIGIHEYGLFDFNYVSKTDSWGNNRGLKPEGFQIVMQNKDLIQKYKDVFVIHRFINRHLSKVLEKSDGDEYSFLTYQQKINILKEHESSLEQIRVEFLDVEGQIFQNPQPTPLIQESEISKDLIIRSLIISGIEQDKLVEKLQQKIIRLKN